MKLKKSVNISMLLAISIVFNIVESIIPVFNGQIPGIKLGLANVIIVTVLYTYSFKDAFFISIFRVFIVGILRIGIFSLPFFFSIAGSILSICMMNIFKHTKLSIIGVSVIGSIFHTIGQILVALIVLNNINILMILPIILMVSIFTGIIIGSLAKELTGFYNENIK